MKAIYQILNKKNNKFYIGSSNNIENRFRSHKYKLRKNIHHSPILQKSYNKYGKNNFEFRILEETDNLLEREQYYLDKLKPKYNISLSAYSVMLGRKHSDKTKKLFSRMRKGKKLGPGPKWTSELREKRISARLAQNYHHPEKTKRKMSRTSKRLKRWLDLKDSIENRQRPIIDNLGNKFKSLTETANYHKISRQTVCDILKGRHYKTRKKISFKYDKS
jgi:group I intron endonuclease